MKREKHFLEISFNTHSTANLPPLRILVENQSFFKTIQHFFTKPNFVGI